mgnify:CR=1 FL=1
MGRCKTREARPMPAQEECTAAETSHRPAPSAIGGSAEALEPRTAFGLQGVGLAGFGQLFPKLQWPWVKEESALVEYVSEEDSPVQHSNEGQVKEDSTDEPELVAEEEPAGPSFASYTEEDFKPPSFEEMEKDMTELRKKRAGFPEQIGRRAHEINFRDEDIEDAWVTLEKALGSGKGEGKAFASLGQAILSAGLNDPGLEELRGEEREVADRMLNLQMQLHELQ